MRRTLCALLWLAGTLLTLAGCSPYGKEPDGLLLVRAVGVDGKEPVVLTAVCADMDGQAAARGRAAGQSFDQARLALPWTGEREMALTNLSYIIIGNTADLEEVLTRVLADRKISPAATLWAAEDAGLLLEAGGDPAARLDILTAAGVAAPTAAQALAALWTQGRVTVPVLARQGDTLTAASQAEWRRGIEQ